MFLAMHVSIVAVSFKLNSLHAGAASRDRGTLNTRVASAKCQHSTRFLPSCFAL